MLTDEPVPSVVLPPAHVTARALADTLRTLHTNMLHGHYVRHTDIEATTLLAEEHAADLEAAHTYHGIGTVSGVEDQSELENTPVYYADGSQVPRTDEPVDVVSKLPTILGDEPPASTPYTKFPDPNAAGYTETSAPAAGYLTNPVEDEDAPQEA